MKISVYVLIKLQLLMFTIREWKTIKKTRIVTENYYFLGCDIKLTGKCVPTFRNIHLPQLQGIRNVTCITQDSGIYWHRFGPILNLIQPALCSFLISEVWNLTHKENSHKATRPSVRNMIYKFYHSKYMNHKFRSLW
jgi:hypothetical protein